MTSFTAENYRSIDEEIKLSFEADTGIKDMNNKGFTIVANTRVLNAKAFMEPTPAVSRTYSRPLAECGVSLFIR